MWCFLLSSLLELCLSFSNLLVAAVSDNYNLVAELKSGVSINGATTVEQAVHYPHCVLRPFAE
jgi:hypothetical protein